MKKLALLTAGLSLLLAGNALAQNQPAQPPQQGGQTDADRQKRIDEFRQQAESRMKELLQANDEEWSVLKPRIDKIQTLQRSNDSRRVGFGMLMANNASWRTRSSQQGGQPPQQPQGNPPQGGFAGGGGDQSSIVYQKANELKTALESKEGTPDVLKTKLAELRAAKTASKAEVTRSQEELRQLCSIRQESVLVMLGLLD